MKNSTFGHYKLVYGNPGVPDAWCWPPQGNSSTMLNPMPAVTTCAYNGSVPADTTSPILFNLQTDPTETTNVAGQYPEIVGRMAVLLDGYIASAVTPLNLTPDQRNTCSAAVQRANSTGCWGPWT